MHVLIVEPFYLGHRLNIAGLLLEAVLRLPGVKATLLTTPEAEKSEQFKTWIAPRLGGASAILRTDIPTHRQQQITNRYLNELLKSVERVTVESDINHVMIPAGDGITNVTSVRQTVSPKAYRQAEWETMLFRGRSAYLPTKNLRERILAAGLLSAIRLSPMDVIHHMDPIIAEDMFRRERRFAGRLEVIPDPVDPIEAELTKPQARQRLGLPEDGRLIGITGQIDGRKGGHLLIQGFVRNVRAGRLAANDRLLLIGKMNPEIREIVESLAADLLACGQVIAIDRFVSDIEMSNGLSAMDVVATPYPAHIGSASIAIRAAAQRRPVLASTFGWLGLIVPRFGLGTVCNVDDPEVFDAAMVRALDEAADYVQGEPAREFVRYSAVSNFQAHWTQRLSARMNIPPTPVLRWEALARA